MQQHKIQLKTLDYGLYLHIPFCRSICPYCDFSKSSEFNSVFVKAYMDALKSQLELWIAALSEGVGIEFTSLFIGGGTPSLLTREYEGLFAVIKKLLSPAAECTLEANPEDLSIESLKFWRDLGLNRLSVGIQSFTDEGLKFLGRRHSAKQSVEALTRARSIFERVSVDLIYGWQGQTLIDLQKDLRCFDDLELSHLSAYNLDYVPSTPLGRRFHRGLIEADPEERDAELYHYLRQSLESKGFSHYEISNWARKGAESSHNERYWQALPVIGIGSGAHGHVRGPESYGLRYHYHKQWQGFKRGVDEVKHNPWSHPSLSLEKRNGEDALTELVGSSLRTSAGLDLKRAQEWGQRVFEPRRPAVQKALEAGKICLSQDRITLDPELWFFDNYWCTELLLCFYP